MKKRRCRCTVTWVPSGSLFAIGGTTESSEACTTVEVLRCTLDTDAKCTREWEEGLKLNTPRSGHTATYFDEKILVVGGTRTGEDLAEMFTLPCQRLPIGQWSLLVSDCHVTQLAGILPLEEKLFALGNFSWLGVWFS